MCTYLMETLPVTAHGYTGEDWIDCNRAVVSFDHPERAATEHALRIDLRTDDPARRLAVELDASSARRLAESILEMLSSDEALVVL